MCRFIVGDSAVLKGKIAEFISRKPPYSNYFGIDFENVDYIECSETLLLRKSYDNFSRIYYLSSNAAQLVGLLGYLSGKDIINIPSKAELSVGLTDLLLSGGYALYATYERQVNNHVESRGEFAGYFAEQEDVSTIYDILYLKFNPFTDRLPSRQELMEMVDKKEILVNRDGENKVTGILTFTLKKAVCNFNHLIDTTESSNGLFLLLKMFDYMGENHVAQSAIWVNINNQKMKKIYQILGYKPDGLKDYTFIKQQ
ncbi:MAG: hypothetical protein LBT25_06670 [Candidatus Symbiothrix sp.]|jgi:hypothetical protein|nr:hypothetical protein [Candidatus Symbiothrix sp.]